jgi:hypothetical protein
LEGGKREREEDYKGERKGRRLKGGDSGKEGRGKGKRFINGKGRTWLKGGDSRKEEKGKEKRVIKGKERG